MNESGKLPAKSIIKISFRIT